MEKFHIALTDDEAALLSQIDLRDQLPPGTDGHAVYQSNRKPIIALLTSLTERNAIPEHRIRYFTDPDYKQGRIKGSRKELFERNGNDGAEIYEHPNFKQYLRYFLFGPELPDRAIVEFEEEIGDPKWVSGSDAIALAKKAVKIARAYQIQKHEAADNFFKLALDMGINFSQADQMQGIIRRSSLK
ncbi:hypothetical protein [Bradyrhizobium sp. 6(2017)]|uniref:hypothetical protein n=1 Tax=Bradyrhizobium sp. 6(2017) TaxID=1197460 RepID=UPI0013E13644|nr:hypothetical protein [Bradyrhizobium sp. 6(2017)]QIG92150.1 hypothetical protein G6P99_06285 [Bradyrhizobium sp. 6(2017)]